MQQTSLELEQASKPVASKPKSPAPPKPSTGSRLNFGFVQITAALLILISLILIFSADRTTQRHANYILASQTFKNNLLVSQLKLNQNELPLSQLQKVLKQLSQSLQPMLAHPLAQANLSQPAAQLADKLAADTLGLRQEQYLIQQQNQQQSQLNLILQVRLKLTNALSQTLERFNQYKNSQDFAGLSANANRSDLFNALNYKQGEEKFEALQQMAYTLLADSALLLNAKSPETVSQQAQRNQQTQAEFVKMLNDFNDIPTKRALQRWYEQDDSQKVLNSQAQQAQMQQLFAADHAYQNKRLELNALIDDLNQTEQQLNAHILAALIDKKSPVAWYYGVLLLSSGLLIFSLRSALPLAKSVN